ncbi:MAG: hypothetical protein QM743_00735 [Chitinophagaceae bacterium]
MNRDELEQWMKNSLDKQEFVPSEASWERLRLAMDKSAQKDKKKALLLLPSHKRFRIAASVLLLTALGGVLYYVAGDRKNNSVPGVITVSQPKYKHQTPQQTQALQAPVTIAQPLVQTAPRILQHSQSPAQPIAATGNEQPGKDNPTPVNPVTAADIDTLKPTWDMRAFATTQPVPTQKQIGREYSADKDESAAFTLGVAAQLGKANVGSGRYQLGLVVHQRITEKLYAEGTVAVASTAVNYVERNEYPAITANLGTANSLSNKPVDVQYGNNVYAAGITPALGYRITRKLSLSCGFSLYRNLNPSVSLKDEAHIDPAVVSNNLLQEKQSLGNWDAGMTGNAAYTVGKRLALHIQYRQGLSTYMYVNRQEIRNSGVNVGFNYVFHE